MEGLAVFERGGKTYVLVISDDNFSQKQKTVLHAFVMKPCDDQNAERLACSSNATPTSTATLSFLEPIICHSKIEIGANERGSPAAQQRCRRRS